MVLSADPSAYLPIHGGEKTHALLKYGLEFLRWDVCSQKPPPCSQQRRRNASFPFTSSHRPLHHSWVPFHMRFVPSSSPAPYLSSCLLPLHDHPDIPLLHPHAGVRYFSSFPYPPSWPSRHLHRPRHWPRPNRTKMTNRSLPLTTTPQPRGFYGRCSKLNKSTH